MEPIHEGTNQFGTDVPRVSMSFAAFLASLKAKDGPYHYLTTQYASEDDEGEEREGEEGERITTLPPPTNALADDFPRVPRVMGNLALQQVNLWLGKSKAGASSGLVSTPHLPPSSPPLTHT